MSVTCIVPCYNESATIGPILELLIRSELIGQIIVADDSTDGTATVVDRYADRVDHIVRSGAKLGKGGAIRRVLPLVRHPVTLLLDADIRGLEERHLAHLILPVLRDEADMCVGIFYRGGDNAQFFRMNTIAISGQRALRTDLLAEAMRDDLAGYYGPEICMNYYCRLHGMRRKKVTLFDADDQPKYVKHGIVDGGREFLRETADVLSKYGQLYLWRYPVEKTRRIATTQPEIEHLVSRVSAWTNRLSDRFNSYLS
jgi:glycosyltransferase involved in cell wall biosynthesis